jgi:predicted acetyltransferase
MHVVQRPLTEADLDQAWEIEREAFNVDDTHREQWEKWERDVGPERFEGVFVDGRLVAMAGALPLGQWFGGRAVAMGGLRAVGVRAEQRGRGYGTRAVRAALEAMRVRGQAISACYPAVMRPYRALGWEVAGTLFFREVPTRSLKALAGRDVAMHRATPDDRATVRASYDRIARETDGFVDRPDGRWRWYFDRTSDAFLHVAGDEGYVLYRQLPLEAPYPAPDAFRVLVLELLATTPRALRALWGMLGDADSVVRSVVFRCGPTDPLTALLDSPDVVVRRERQWMLRLVDAAAAVAGRGYAPDVQATVPLDVRDAVCPWNAGRWTLRIEDGAGRLEPGGDGAVALDVGAFAALYSGWATTTWLERAGLLDGGAAADRHALDRAFAGPIPWMLDEF